MEVTDWLRDLGLDRYAAAFRENDITADLLSSLTAQDLRDLGVTAVGHRRRLLDAIAALPGDHPSQPGSEASSGDRPSAERRQLTVLFCDLVDSTPLSTRLDPEDLREILEIYRATVLAAVTDKHGYVAKYLGDGVLAYFGWPNPDEAHADSAVRAALAILEAVRPRELRVRIGIATGLVVVGDLIGAGAAREHPAIGETPNLAARLQALAEPGTILVSDATRAQLGRMFELEALGPAALKGFEKPVLAWRVRRETGITSRSEALYSGAVPPLIGRDEELDVLLRRWRQAKAGEGRVVLLSGEAGIGKSRLLAALEERLAGEPHVSLRYFCSAHHQDSALYPIIARLEQKAGFARGDSAEDRLAKLAAVLAETDPSPEDVAVVAELLSIPKEAGYPALELSPQRRKERVFAALAHRLASFARQAPVLFLFEDAHWSDPTSLELLDAVVERVPALPVLAVISFRPDFSPSWFGRAGVSQIILGRLDSREATELAERVTRDHALSPALLDRIVVQADGVPLFIEELAKAVQETTELSPGSTLTVPDTLQASLMARLDRLPAAKQVAQIGAVIGREFSHTLLEAVVQMPESQLARGIEELVASGLVFRSGTPPEAVYTFKHALVQDVAYESLLRSRRAEAHAAVADHLEQESGSAGERAALIGFHCAHAGAAARAAAYYRLAGEQLEKHGSFSETESLLRRGLLLIDPLAHGPERQRLEAELLFALGHLLYIKVGISSSAAHQALDKAVAKSRELNDVGLLSRALRDRSAGLMQRGDLRAALIDAHELQQVIGGSDDVKTRILADVLTSSVQFHRGQFTSAHVHMNSAEELNGIGQARDFDVTHESNWVVTGIFFGVFSLCCLGFIERSNGKMAHLWEEARRQTPFHHAINLANFSRFELIATHNKTAVARLTSDLDLLAQEHGFPQYLLVAKMNQGYLDATIRGSKAGVETARQAFAEMRAAGHERWGPYHHFLIADALACGEDTAEALSTLSDGLAMSAKTEEVWLDSELHRLRGELLLKTTEPEPLQAEQALRTAIDIARGQSAKLFELRAAMSLALLWCGQGRRTEAHDLLAPVYDWFTEGFGSTDLQEARAVLAELGRLR